jgi:DNA-binding SARP family transcriptional activator
VEFKLLGPLEVRDGDAVLPLGGNRQRALLAVLLVHAGEAVSRDRLIDELWGEGSPDNAVHRLETQVSRLRQKVGLGELLVTRPGGYALEVDPASIDARAFERLLDQGRRANLEQRAAEAEALLEQALSLWHGEALGDIAYLSFARLEAERLEELRLSAIEERIDARLALGQHRALVSEVEALTASHPLRERPRGQLMLALYRSGRQADALEVYQSTRAHLAEELGLEPGRELRALQAQILEQSEELARADTHVGRPPREGHELPLPAAVAARLRDSRLVGRATELRCCAEESERAAAGEQRSVLIAGEPGIGKTRLVAELAGRLHDAGMTVLWGRCDPDLGVPYQPFVEILTHYLRFGPQHVWAEHRAQYGSALARLVPELSASVTPPLSLAEQPGEEHRHVMFAAVEALLRRIAAERPLVLVLDDLQWADKPTVLMLKYLLLSSQPTPALVLGTHRSSDGTPDAVSALLADLRREPGITRLTLAGLPAEDVIEMAQDLADERLEPAGAELVHGLWKQTGGNPFFVGEIVRSLSEAGGVNRAGRALAAGGREAVALPESVLETIADRVGRLGLRATEVLSAAAVIGAEFDVKLLAGICEARAEQLVGLLDSAAAAALITEVPGMDLRYAFAHQLIALALYEQLGAGRRRALHARALAGLEQVLTEHERRQRIGELARHALFGVPIVATRKSVQYARLAGERALGQLAPQEALRWFDLALSGAERPDPQPAGGGDRDRIRCDLLIGRGIAQYQVGDPDFRVTLLQAGALARRLGDGQRLVRAATISHRPYAAAGTLDIERIEMLEAALVTVGDRDSGSRARLLALLAGELTFSGDWGRRKQLSDESMAIATRLGDPGTVNEVLKRRFVTIWTPETLAQRVVEADRELAIAEELGDPVAVFYGLHWKAAAAVETGQLTVASKLVERQTELADRTRQAGLRFAAAYARVPQVLISGQLEAAERCAENARRLATESGKPDAVAMFAGEMLNIRYEQGRLAELEPLIAQMVELNPGIPAFRAALVLARAEAGMRDQAMEALEVDAAADFSALAYDFNWLTGLVVYAQAVASLGDCQAAGKLHRLLEPWRDQVAFNIITVWGLVERFVGNLDRVLGRYDEAENALVRAAERHEQMGAPIWLARTRLDLGQLLLERGRDTTHAAMLLGQARRTAHNLGCASIERQASILLEDLRQPA